MMTQWAKAIIFLSLLLFLQKRRRLDYAFGEASNEIVKRSLEENRRAENERLFDDIFQGWPLEWLEGCILRRNTEQNRLHSHNVTVSKRDMETLKTNNSQWCKWGEDRWERKKPTENWFLSKCWELLIIHEMLDGWSDGCEHSPIQWHGKHNAIDGG